MQNPLLFKDPNSIRCKRFSNYSDAFKRGVFDLKQGLINSKLNCTVCGISTNVMERIKCSLCSRMFHGSCLPDKVTKNTVACVAKNPSVWWFCLECLHIANSVCVVAPMYQENLSGARHHIDRRETPKSGRMRMLSGDEDDIRDSVLDGNSWEFSDAGYATPDFKRNIVSSTPSRSPDKAREQYHDENITNGHVGNDVYNDKDDNHHDIGHSINEVSYKGDEQVVTFHDEAEEKEEFDAEQRSRDKSAISRDIKRYKTRDVATQTPDSKRNHGYKSSLPTHLMGKQTPHRNRSASGSSLHSSNSSDTYSNASDISIISVEKRRQNNTDIGQIKNLIAQSRRVAAKPSYTPKKSNGGSRRK